MSFRSAVSVDEDDIRDFLVDLWFARGGQGEEFEEKNPGMLYAYSLQHLCHSRDALSKAMSLVDLLPASGREDDDEDHLDRLGCLASSDDPEADDQNEELVDLLDELAAVRDSGFSAAISDLLGISDRRARTLSSVVRQQKIKSLIERAAKARGIGPQELKRLAASVANEHRRSIEGDADEIEAFEQMMGVCLNPTAMQAEIRSRRAKQQPSVPQQLELV
jgi:hypothetical protein